MNPGIYNISEQEHRSLISYPSISELNLLDRAPIIYKHQILDGNKSKSSKAQEEGTLIHLCILEHDKFLKKVKPLPNGVDFRLKKFADLKEQIELEKQDGIFHVKQYEFDKYLEIRDAVLKISFAKDLLEEGAAEKTVIFDEESTGVRCRGRLDSCSIPGNFILDIKTTVDAKNFLKSVVDYKYHKQAAFYLDGFDSVTAPNEKPQEFYWIAVEKEAPYLCALYKASPEMLRIGRIEYRRQVELYKRCFMADSWPGISESVFTLDLPEWYSKRFAEIETIKNGEK